MFFALSKILHAFMMPTTWVLMLLVASLLLKSAKWSRITRLLGIYLLLFISNPFIANIAMKLWETPAKPYTQFSETYDYVIVLSGFTSPKKPEDRAHFNKGADRLIHAIALYNMGKAKKIVLTGGVSTLLSDQPAEADVLWRVTKMLGVKEQDIIVEKKARNTFENAKYTKELIENGQQVLLVTSAFHMYRAKMCFKKMGIPVTVFSTDLYSKPISWTPDDLLVPSVSAIKIWHILMKEWLGVLAYWVNGYI